METSSSPILRPCTWVFVAMLALTFVTYLIGKAGLSTGWVSLLVLGFALLKGHLVGDYFMGLGRLRSLWRWVIVLWLILPGILITTAFELSR